MVTVSTLAPPAFSARGVPSREAFLEIDEQKITDREYAADFTNQGRGRDAPVIRRTAIFINPDRSRVLVRPLTPAGERRIVEIISRLLALPESEIERLLGEVLMEFSGLRQKTRDLFLERFEFIRPHLVADANLSEARRLMIGSYFTREYSLGAAPLLSPSIVPHPDQSDLPPGALRFVLGLRATGEGHVSSLTFRTGVIGADHSIGLGSPTRFVIEPLPVPDPACDRARFTRQLSELGFADEFTRRILVALAPRFTLAELRTAIARVRHQPDEAGMPDAVATADAIVALALSNYQLRFPADLRMAERLPPTRSPDRSRGLDDVRLVSFRHDDGTRDSFATYALQDRRAPHPGSAGATHPLDFAFITPAGAAVQNKDAALFPRLIGGRHALLSHDGRGHACILFSDDLHFWRASPPGPEPIHDWEAGQLGNCGAPIETRLGWLVLSHGVGPLRQYRIGARLLDLDDPAKVVGRLREPLIAPAGDEREGHVPNAVHSCGALLHGDTLLIPYSVSDYATRFATVSLAALLAAMA